jgi:hypothetical protein
MKSHSQSTKRVDRNIRATAALSYADKDWEILSSTRLHKKNKTKNNIRTTLSRSLQNTFQLKLMCMTAITNYWIYY